MNDETPTPQGFQWKWVWITLGMFILFYIIPLLTLSSFRFSFGDKIIAGWSLGGVVVISAVSAMLSKGVTIWEPAIAGVMVTVIWFAIFQMVTGHPLEMDLSRLAVTAVAIFGLSLLGAGLGEGIQNVREGQKEKPNQESNELQKEEEA